MYSPFLFSATLPWRLPKSRRHIGFVDKCRHVYAGEGVSGSYVLWRKKGHCFEHAGAFYFLTTVLLRPKGRPFSNLTARGLFLPSWGSIFQSTQRHTMLSSSGLISRFCRKYVSPHSHMTNPEWILGAQSILLTLLWSCPWKQWERISDQSRQVLHSEAKDFWGVGLLSAGGLFSSLAALH